MPALKKPQNIVDRLIEFQAVVRDQIVASRQSKGLHQVSHATAADTIYQIDTLVEPILEDFCRDWAKRTPLVLIAEGIEDERGNEGMKVYPEGTSAGKPEIRLIIDPIDGTRGLMYDKRAAWALAAVTPNRGAKTCLRDAAVSVMSELPTSKMGQADVLWAIRGKGARGRRVDLSSGRSRPLVLQPSKADTINHGFASVANFFPGTKVLASELMEQLARGLIGPADVTKATVFDDQYISTGGQFYELIVGHDRFNADLRPVFYAMQGQSEGMCCHPYDCAGLLVAEEAGVVVTDEFGRPLNGPLDVTTGISWLGYASQKLRRKIEPVVRRFLAAAPKRVHG
jgi:fructose-1,6-bisphosphatase/inositol monophosphatase family enzyme